MAVSSSLVAALESLGAHLSSLLRDASFAWEPSFHHVQQLLGHRDLNTTEIDIHLELLDLQQASAPPEEVVPFESPFPSNWRRQKTL